MIIDCISDLHGYYPKLEGGDLLIVAGDLTKRDVPEEYGQFYNWLYEADYKKKIVIAGNHDNFLEQIPNFFNVLGSCDYLCDSGTEFEGLKIWGSPWTKSFPGMNPDCKAFCVDTEEELAEKWALIPKDIDILITHSPPRGLRDYRPLTRDEMRNNISSFNIGYGSITLYDRMFEIGENDGKTRWLICGHIHEGYGLIMSNSYVFDKTLWKVANASHVNENYEPVNKPIRIIL